jgi:hypothetical protein
MLCVPVYFVFFGGLGLKVDYFMWIEQEALRGLQKRNELSAPYICLPLFSSLLLPLHPSLFWCFV